MYFIFLCIITFIMFIYFLETVQSFHIIFSQNFFLLLGQSFIQKNVKVSAESFWVILGLILLVFLYLLRVVKPFLIKVCKNVFCITPILTVLNIFFTANPFLLEAILGCFLVCLFASFSIF